MNDQPYEIECFVARNPNTGKEYDFPDYWGTKSFADFYDEESWEIYAKIKNTPTTLPKV